MVLAFSLLDGTSLTRLASPEILFFAACALIGELVPLKVVTRGVEGEVTTSTTFAFATLLIAGPARAFVALVGASFAADALRGKAPTKLLFNSSQYAITITADRASTLHLLTGVPRAGAEFHFAPDDLPGILAAAGVFFVVNSVLVATVIALAQQLRIGRYLVAGLLLPGLDRRPDARPRADGRPRRRLRAAVGRAAASCRCSPSTAAAARRSPRSTRRCTTRSPACRTARCSSDRIEQALTRRPRAPIASPP